MDDSIDLNKARQFLIKLIPRAGEILKKYFISGKFTSISKGGVDFLTQADEEADKFLRENIKKNYPETNLLTEETAPKDYSSLKKLNNLWIIDPLDGTINFSRKNPHFAISVGLVDKGKSKLGVVYIPTKNDLYWAQIDQKNAFLNGAPIKVSATNNMAEAVIACDLGWNLKKRLAVVPWIKHLGATVRQIKFMGSSVADLASLADGRIDAYIHSGLKPWDTAASSLFIEKAGGKITTATGTPWDVFKSGMLASNGILHAKILELINQ